MENKQITINLSEYIELLEIKGRYLELKDNYYLFYDKSKITWSPVYDYSGLSCKHNDTSASLNNTTKKSN